MANNDPARTPKLPESDNRDLTAGHASTDGQVADEFGVRDELNGPNTLETAKDARDLIFSNNVPVAPSGPPTVSPEAGPPARAPDPKQAKEVPVANATSDETPAGQPEPGEQAQARSAGEAPSEPAAKLSPAISSHVVTVSRPDWQELGTPAQRTQRPPLPAAKPQSRPVEEAPREPAAKPPPVVFSHEVTVRPPELQELGTPAQRTQRPPPTGPSVAPKPHSGATTPIPAGEKTQVPPASTAQAPASSRQKEPDPARTAKRQADPKTAATQQSRTPPPPPSPGPTPKWEVVEPTDQTERVEHEECTLVSFKHWNAMAASLRGKLHAHKGLWRDDAYTLESVDDWTIVAVTDGAGSARLARVGARIASQEATQKMKELLEHFCLAPAESNGPGESDLLRLKTFLEQSAGKARTELIREAQKRRCPANDLHTTCLLLIHTPFQGSDVVAAIQVGDGSIGLYTEDRKHTVIGVADHGQYSSETCFLTTPHIEHSFGARVRFAIKKGVRAIAIMCDGVSDDFFPEDKRLIDIFDGEPIPELKTRSGDKVWGLLHKDKGILADPKEGKALLDWLRYEKKGSSDDRTLVLLYRRT